MGPVWGVSGPLYSTPVQGTAADITKNALALLPSRLDVTGARILGTIMHVPSGHLETMKRRTGLTKRKRSPPELFVKVNYEIILELPDEIEK